MNFKEQLERDLKGVFHNSGEHAEIKEIGYNGNYYNIPVILDYEGAQDRKKPSSDNADGIFSVEARLYIAFSDLKVMPRKGVNIEVEEELFNIIKVANEAGEIILDLERLDE